MHLSDGSGGSGFSGRDVGEAGGERVQRREVCGQLGKWATVMHMSREKQVIWSIRSIINCEIPPLLRYFPPLTKTGFPDFFPSFLGVSVLWFVLYGYSEEKRVLSSLA
jgi:hypothetical protein